MLLGLLGFPVESFHDVSLARSFAINCEGIASSGHNFLGPLLGEGGFPSPKFPTTSPITLKS